VDKPIIPENARLWPVWAGDESKNIGLYVRLGACGHGGAYHEPGGVGRDMQVKVGEAVDEDSTAAQGGGELHPAGTVTEPCF